MAGKRSESKWKTLRRCLAILRRLQQGPADRQALMQAAREMVPDAYGTGTANAQRKRFERDLENLRYQLRATIDWDPRAGVYRLSEFGPFGGIDLSDRALRGLAFLLETFGTESGASETVCPFLDEVLRALPLDRQHELHSAGSALRLELRRLDTGQIAPLVWQKVRRAVAARHVLQFQYTSSRHELPDPQTHTVEPYQLRFHRGHYELRAYCRYQTNPPGRERHEAGWRRYRLDHILAEGIKVLPQKLPPGQRWQRPITVHYRLSPKLVRSGISRHFEDMTVGQPDADGWVEITGQTDDLFEAMRLLLAYGEHCLVQGPPALVRRMKQATHEMAKLYKILP